MKILVLGCDGYIGNALVQRLLALDHDVVGVDNFLRRTWIKSEMRSDSAIPILGMEDKTKEFEIMGNFSFYDLPNKYWPFNPPPGFYLQASGRYPIDR